MSVTIKTLTEFTKRAKVLAKRYKSFQADYLAFIDSLEKNPFQGVALGDGVYKIRMSIAAKGKGKSGGARVLTYNVTYTPSGDINVTLLSIFDKSDMENVSDKYIKGLVSQLKQ